MPDDDKTAPPLVMRYNPSDARIAEVRGQHEALLARLPDLILAEDIDPINEALKVIVPLRTELERTRVNLKAESLEFGRKVDAEAARLKRDILAFETPIQEAKAKILAAEKARAEAKVKAEEEAAAAERKRLADLEAEKKRQEDEARAAEAKKLAEERAELDRQKAEAEAKAKVEADKLAAERAELDRKEREVREAQEKLDREKREEAERARREKEAAELKAKLEREAKEAAERELQERIAREKADREEAERQAKIRAEREEAERKAAEAARPDIDKIRAFGDRLAAFIAENFPDVKAGSRAAQFLAAARQHMTAVAVDCQEFKFPTRGGK